MSDNLPQFDSGAEGVVESICECCGKRYWIDPANYQVAHDLPICLEFQTREVVDFVIWNRKLKEAKQSGPVN